MSIQFIYKGGALKDTTATSARSMWQRDNQWDIVSPDRQVPAVTNLKYVVINLQTHDCNQDNHQVATGHVVELAWKLFDDAGTTLETKQYLLKPYGGYKQISESATSIHGITTACADKFGSDSYLVFDELIKAIQQVPQDGFVVAHDMDVKNTIMRNSLTPEQQEVWDATPKCNTNDKALLKYLPPDVKRKHYNFKYVKGSLSLPEMLRNIGQQPAGVYDVRIASRDTQWTWDIFMYFKNHADCKELKWNAIVIVPTKYPGIMRKVGI